MVEKKIHIGDVVFPNIPGERDEFIRGGVSYGDVTNLVCRMPELKLGEEPKWWKIAFGISILGVFLFFSSVFCVIWFGIGMWGNNNPVFWAWDIVNFVFWVGIGHAGTLISAILFLFRQKWRTSINRYAEAMTIFAVICAACFPVFHMGRVWTAHFLAPIPNQMGMWPNFRSPLLWDVFAVSTYFTISLLFWYVGLIPDLATLRDRAKGTLGKKIYGFFSLGWRGSVKDWYIYEKAYLFLAALSTPLVLSVHSVVSFDFATSQLSGWHTTIFPPYFVAGAILSGFAMVQTLIIPARIWLDLKNLITIQHIENMNKVILLTSNMVGYAYGIEFFIAWYSKDLEEFQLFIHRATGWYAWAYWTMVICNVVIPQLFWMRRIRTSIFLTFIMSIAINIGMWFERFVIIVTSLSQGNVPSSWSYYSPRIWDVFLFIGSFGLFFFLFLLFIRFLPVVAMAEVKGVMKGGHCK
ncbi:MAG: polysulfide reductase NrfD [Deltaproteobacteria bacterium]|nr:MAG: polysulfide reductase NrfD [Deltaproteobacteria bacterium]